MKLIPCFCIFLIAVNLVNAKLPPKTGSVNSTGISSDLNLTTCYNDFKEKLNALASNEWSRIHQDLSTTLYEFEESADTLLTEGINVTNCFKESKRSIIQMIVPAIEENDRILSESIEKIEKTFHDKLWVLEMQKDWPDCYKKQPPIRNISLCIDKDVLRNPTVDKSIKHRSFVNMIIFRSKSVISEMEESLNIMKQSMNSSIEGHTKKFILCVHDMRILTINKFTKMDSTTQRNQTGAATTKERNFENPIRTQKSIWQEIDTKNWLITEKTYFHTSRNFQDILEPLINNGNNLMCCYEPAMEHVNNASKRAQIEHSKCFKNQSDEFQMSIITEISNVKIRKSLFDSCVQTDIFHNINSIKNFLRCSNYDVMNKNVFQKFDAKMEAYMQSHRGLLESCLKILMASYRDSVAHGYVKFDTCLANQITKQCNPDVPTNPDREIKISSENSFDDKYDWVLWNFEQALRVPRLG